MTVKLLIITHEEIGSALLKAVNKTLGGLPLSVTLFPVKYDTEPEVLLTQLRNLTAHLDQEQGILILTDLYGSTPFNLATSLLATHSGIQIIAGLNFPMLLRIMNYPCLPLAELAEKALSGGKEGIVSYGEGKIA